MNFSRLSCVSHTTPPVRSDDGRDQGHTEYVKNITQISSMDMVPVYLAMTDILIARRPHPCVRPAERGPQQAS